MSKQQITVTGDDELAALLARTNTNNPKAQDVQAVRRHLRAQPQVWKETCNFLLQAQWALIEQTTATALTKEMMNFRCEQMRAELLTDGASALEELLVDQIVLAWLRLALLEGQYTQRMGEGVTIDGGLYYEKRLTEHHKRYERTITALARVRKLLQPKVRNQLNVAVFNAPNGIPPAQS
jgi:hypothetical protein